jgi:hypothetical protein
LPDGMHPAFETAEDERSKAGNVVHPVAT